MLNENYFWAWRRLKYGTDSKEDPRSRDIHDYEILEIMLETIRPTHPSKGTGRYDRVVSYITNVTEMITWLKQNWHNDDELLSAFMLGLDVACDALKREILLIDQKPLDSLSYEDWRKP